MAWKWVLFTNLPPQADILDFIFQIIVFVFFISIRKKHSQRQNSLREDLQLLETICRPIAVAFY